VPDEDLLLLFPVQSSETILRRGHREAGGEGAGSSSFSVRAGEDFEVVVEIKTPFGPATGPHVEHMMREIRLLPEGVLKKAGEPQLSLETGMACFPARVEQSGDFEVCAAVECKGTARVIGRETCRELISKQPGNYKRFDNYDTRRAAKREWGEHLEQFLRTRGE
jgi:hypothetical protein